MYRSTVVVCLVLAATASQFLEPATPSTAASTARTVVISIDDVPLGGGRWSGDDVATVQRINDGILEALVAHGAPGRTRPSPGDSRRLPRSHVRRSRPNPR